MDRVPTSRLALAGRLLVAMPSVTERAFHKSAILICAHSSTGAMGLLVNRPATNMTLRRLLRESGLHQPDVALGVPIHAGGPADIERTFVLHTPDYRLPAHTISVNESIWMTPHDDVVQDLGRGMGPERAFIAMGYCGWGAGQLEEEMHGGIWLDAAATPEIVFDSPAADRWARVMENMGVSPSGLSGFAGHA